MENPSVGNLENVLKRIPISRFQKWPLSIQFPLRANISAFHVFLPRCRSLLLIPGRTQGLCVPASCFVFSFCLYSVFPNPAVSSRLDVQTDKHKKTGYTEYPAL